MLKMTVGNFSFIEFMYCIFKHTLVEKSCVYTASSSTSRLEANAGFLRLLMKGIFDPNVLLPFDKKLIS